MVFYIEDKKLIDEIKYDESMEAYEIPQELIETVLIDEMNAEEDRIGKWLSNLLKKHYSGNYLQEITHAMLTKILKYEDELFNDEGVGILKLANKVLKDSISRSNNHW